ncbi:hypothetical protein OGAPHI_001843 [Ogataea philodendri]|uniref:Nudix hydrolase domain-containing protein n=1 Tax=Ogataea philodendri TaxID=1378263 RepID=A0A9P8T744_9ASCO|nr:uncharacterized protein OGAPHI_001843 [Ogataea philodendri]KAH3668089.1 hypothetical protein OGAPHI_001843 [Ogataea philodendri]
MSLMPNESSIYVDVAQCNSNDNVRSFQKTDAAREGRKDQIFNKATGARLVAGCVVLNSDHSKVLLISSSKHKDRWILPKGGIESDEIDSFSMTAARETWEEAGAVGKIIGKLPVVEDLRYRKDARKMPTPPENDKIPRSEFHFYEMEIEQLCDKWPEIDKRMRKWCTYEEAKHEVLKAKRYELAEVLGESRIHKNYTPVVFDEHSNVMLDAEPEKDTY